MWFFVMFATAVCVLFLINLTLTQSSHVSAIAFAAERFCVRCNLRPDIFFFWKKEGTCDQAFFFWKGEVKNNDLLPRV